MKQSQLQLQSQSLQKSQPLSNSSLLSDCPSKLSFSTSIKPSQSQPQSQPLTKSSLLSDPPPSNLFCSSSSSSIGGIEVGIDDGIGNGNGRFNNNNLESRKEKIECYYNDSDGDYDLGDDYDENDEYSSSNNRKQGNSNSATTADNYINRQHNSRSSAIQFTPVKGLTSGPLLQVEIKNPFPYPLYYKILKTDSKLVRTTLYKHGFVEASEDSKYFNIAWASATIKMDIISSMNMYQRANHFPRSDEMTRKNKLYANISRMSKIHGQKEFGFLPKTFHLPDQWNEFKAEFLREQSNIVQQCLNQRGLLAETNSSEKNQQVNPSNHKQGLYNSWIVKPSASSRGRGIFVTNELQEIASCGMSNCVVSRYIANPLLVNDYKFDLRLYVLVTSFSPLRIYLFKDGLCRFATEPYSYSLSNLKNAFIHLTNYSINKKSENFVCNNDADVENFGSKWSLSALLSELKGMGVDTGRLMDDIKTILVKVLIAIQPFVATACHYYVPYHRNCFELFGFDILIDDHIRPWLLEVNKSPSLSCNSPLDLKIKASVISEVLNIIGLHCFNHQRATIEEANKIENFERLFPCPSAKYDPFFDSMSSLNVFVRRSIFGSSRNFSKSLSRIPILSDKRLLPSLWHSPQQSSFIDFIPPSHTDNHPFENTISSDNIPIKKTETLDSGPLETKTDQMRPNKTEDEDVTYDERTHKMKSNSGIQITTQPHGIKPFSHISQFGTSKEETVNDNLIQGRIKRPNTADSSTRNSSRSGRRDVPNIIESIIETREGFLAYLEKLHFRLNRSYSPQLNLLVRNFLERSSTKVNTLSQHISGASSNNRDVSLMLDVYISKFRQESDNLKKYLGGANNSLSELKTWLNARASEADISQFLTAEISKLRIDHLPTKMIHSHNVLQRIRKENLSITRPNSAPERPKPVLLLHLDQPKDIQP